MPCTGRWILIHYTSSKVLVYLFLNLWNLRSMRLCLFFLKYFPHTLKVKKWLIIPFTKNYLCVGSIELKGGEPLLSSWFPDCSDLSGFDFPDGVDFCCQFVSTAVLNGNTDLGIKVWAFMVEGHGIDV